LIGVISHFNWPLQTVTLILQLCLPTEIEREQEIQWPGIGTSALAVCLCCARAL
jgi:hypothetical protein